MTAPTVALFNRKDWREHRGLSQPTDRNSLVAMWKGFADGDPTGTGQKVAGLAVPGTTQRGYISWNTSTFFWSGGGEYFEQTPAGYRSAVASEGSSLRADPEVGIVLVASALAILPSIIAFQRSFMRGISTGAIKG